MIMNFFTGLSANQGTKPGFLRKTLPFNICFEGIEPADIAENQAGELKRKFETCYNWEMIVEIIASHLHFYFDAYEFETDVKTELHEWLGSFQGWGLLFTLLPFEFQQCFLLLYSHTNLKLQEENVELENYEIFEKLKNLYETETGGLPYTDLIPKVEVKLLQLVGGPKEHERRKILNLRFIGSKFTIIARFSIYKNRIARTLAELAAEVVGELVDDSEELEIPETLKEVVSDKIIDAEWISDYYLAKFQRAERDRKENEAEKVNLEELSIDREEGVISENDDREHKEVEDGETSEPSAAQNNRNGIMSRVFNCMKSLLSRMSP